VSRNPYDIDLDKNPANYQPLSPLSYLARAADVFPDQTAIVHGGLRRTYSEFYARSRKLAQSSSVPVDSSFSPVVRVKYDIEETRVGQRTNYDKLVMEIWTNGTITPQMALVEAAKIMRKHLNPFVQYSEPGPEVPLDEPIEARNGDEAIKVAYKTIAKSAEDSMTLVAIPVGYFKPKEVKGRKKEDYAVEVG
jgi:hypothetical protein